MSPGKMKNLLTSGKGGVLRIDSDESVCSSRQLWTWNQGNTVVNAFTGLPLVVEGVDQWDITMKDGTEDTYYIRKLGGTSAEWLRMEGNGVQLGKRMPWIFTTV